MKVLCLGGFLQNAERLRKRCAPLEKMMRAHGFELEYVDPPLVIPGRDEVFQKLGPTEREADAKWQSLVDRGLNRCWWQYEPGSVPTAPGIEDSLAWILEYIRKNGPYVGIIGFSQGSVVAAMLTVLVPKELGQPPFKFAVCMSGFKLSSALQKYFVLPPDYSTKVVVVYGLMDFVVPSVGSQNLAKGFPNSSEVSWRGGHDVPQADNVIKLIEQALVPVFNKL
ncbi:family of serine hydrolases 1 [Diutina catenulata]